MKNIFVAWKIFRNNPDWALPDKMTKEDQEKEWIRRRKIFAKGWIRGQSAGDEGSDKQIEKRFHGREPS